MPTKLRKRRLQLKFATCRCVHSCVVVVASSFADVLTFLQPEQLSARLRDAALKNKYHEVGELLHAGADAAAADDDGFTAMHAAATTGSVKLLKRLVQHGATANVLDKVRESSYMTVVCASLCVTLCFGSSALSFCCLRLALSNGVGIALWPFARHSLETARCCMLRWRTSLARPSIYWSKGVTTCTGDKMEGLCLKLLKETAASLSSSCLRNGNGTSRYVFRMVVVRLGAPPHLLDTFFAQLGNLDLSYGVPIEGRINIKTDMEQAKWKRRIMVLSRPNQSLYLWAGTRKYPKGPVTRVRSN